MSILEGAGTAAAASTPMQPVQQMQPTQFVVIPQQAAQPVQQVQVLQEVVPNNSYFSMRADTKDYQESMKPWESDNQSYLFACCTDFKVQSVRPQGCCGSVPNVSNSSTAGWVTTVYHKMDSDRLIIKRKSAASTLSQVRKNPLIGLAFLLFIVVVILTILDDEDDEDDELEYITEYNNDYYDDDDEEEFLEGVDACLLISGIICLLAGMALFKFIKLKLKNNL